MISWDLATKVAKGVIASFPKEDDARLSNLSNEMSEFGSSVLPEVERVSGIEIADDRIEVRFASRNEWVENNAKSMQKLLDPIIKEATDSIPEFLSNIYSSVGAVQFGLLFGWMSRRVLGQYDAAMFTNADVAGAPVFVVGSNVLEIESRNDYVPGSFGRWVLLHEITHKLQFEGIDWMASYYRSLISDLVSSSKLTPSDIFEAIVTIIEELRAGRNPIDEAGIAALFLGKSQRQNLKKITSLMTILEGHADFVMSRVAKDSIESADEFEAMVSDRRQGGSPLFKLISRLYGFDAKVRQYANGRKFLEELASRKSDDFIRTIFSSPETLPSVEEIADVETYLSRVSA
ncbi:MAG: zinc-dependent metalloprotease [Actinomycetota bacterium]|nr:zinc-dependent metalloprotease [Actinomycetota bacterium]